MERTLLTNQAGMRNLGADKQGLFSVALDHRRPNMMRLSEKERYEKAVAACDSGDASACETRKELALLSYQRDMALKEACNTSAEACRSKVREAIDMGNIVMGQMGGYVYANSPESGSIRGLNTATIGPVQRPDNFHDAVSKSTSEGLLLEAGNQAALAVLGAAVRGGQVITEAVATTSVVAEKFIQNAALKGLQVGAVHGFKQADEVNALMTAYSYAPAWKSGSVVTEATLQPGTRVKMVVDETAWNLIRDGKTERVFGGWATFDDVPNQAYARNKLVITPEFKRNVGYVIKVEVARPVQAQIGVVGRQGAAPGGGNQLNFLIAPNERSGAFKYVQGSGKRLP